MDSTSTPTLELLTDALSSIPKKYRARVVDAYSDLKWRYARAIYDSAWDAGGLSSGKFCEAVLRFLQYYLTGTNVPFGKHISDFPGQCNKLIQLNQATGNESLRVIIPRSLVFLYTLRGKRGIGHVGGDVEANAIDAASIVRVCDWVVCELIRIFHRLSLEEAQDIVDALTLRRIPAVWHIAGKRRVLKKGLSYKEQTLLLLYSEVQEGVLSEDLFDWTGHTNQSVFRRNVLRNLHSDRLVEYDEENQIVYLSPLGINEVEQRDLHVF